MECGPRVWMLPSCSREQHGLLVFIFDGYCLCSLPLALPGLTLFLFVAHMWDVMSLSTAEQML